MPRVFHNVLHFMKNPALHNKTSPEHDQPSLSASLSQKNKDKKNKKHPATWQSQQAMTQTSRQCFHFIVLIILIQNNFYFYKKNVIPLFYVINQFYSKIWLFVCTDGIVNQHVITIK